MKSEPGTTVDIDDLPLVRFRGNDGGWRGGRIVDTCNGHAVVIDLRRQEATFIAYDALEMDGPRDDVGNLILDD